MKKFLGIKIKTIKVALFNIVKSQKCIFWDIEQANK